MAVVLIRTWSLDHSLAILDLSGRLSAESGVALRDAASDVVRSGRRQLVVNLLSLSTLDAAVLGGLADALRLVRDVGGELKLVVRSGAVIELLARTHLLALFPTFMSEAEAIASVTGEHARGRAASG